MSDILTVHNKTNVDIFADKYLLELDKYTTCPRCKYKLERAKKLLAKIPRIDKLDTLTICNHCQTKVTKSCQECREIANTFIASKMHKNKLLKELLLWLSNVESILEKYEKLSHMLRCTGSHLYTDCLRYISSSPNFNHQPEIGQLLEFNNWTHSTVYPTKNHFSKKMVIMKCPLEIKSESALLYVHDNKIEYNNKMTQLKLWPYKHLEQLKSISKPFQRAIEMKEEFHDCEKLNLHDSLQKVVRRRSIEIRKHTYADRNFINKTYKDEGPGIISQEAELKLILSNNSLRKDRTHMSSPTQHSEEPLQKDFSYCFIKKTTKDQRSIMEHKSSAELLRQFQNKLDIKVEIEEREKEVKRLRKIEEHEKRRLFKAELERKKLHKFKKGKSTKDEDDDELKDRDRIKKKIEPEPIIPKLSVKNINDKNRKNISDIPNVKKTLIIEEKKIETEQKSHAKKKIKLREKVEKEKFQTEKEDRLTREKNEKQRKFEGELRQKKDEEKIAKWQTDKGKTYSNAQEIKRMLTEQVKQEESKNSSQQKGTKREIAANKKSNKDNQDSEIESKTIKEPLSEKQEYKRQKEVTELKSQGINMNQIEVRTPSSDDLILQLVKLKQSHPDRVKRSRPKRLSQLNISSVTITAHKSHKNKKEAECIICNDSELELDLENIVTNNTKRKKINDIIIGGKILKCKPRIEKEFMGNIGIAPLFFKSTFKDDNNIVNVPKQEIPEYMTETKERKPYFGLPCKYPDQEVPKGVIRYALSDRSFIEKGWTMLPTEKVVRKMNVYHMRPAHPEFDWFEHNKNKKLMLYDTGEKLAEFKENGRGRWFYRNGNLALDYYDAEEINAQQRFVIYSSGEPDERGRSQPLTILATFDYLGNGIVFDHAGKIRLKYNQTEGVILDRSIGPVSHWKWHTLNDPPVLQQVMIDIQMAHKDPEILKLGGSADDKAQSDNEEMLAIEFDNFIKEKSKKLSQKFKPFQIKMKALKINDHFSLKVLDQATVYLIFRDGTTNLKINIGMVLDHQDIVDTDTAEVGEVSNSLEKFPARTDSLAALQRSVAYAQRVERVRVERDRWLRPTELHSSADRLIAGISRPLRPPLRVCDTRSTVISANRCKEPATYNLYYDTRLS